MNAIQLKNSAFNGTQLRAQRCGVAQPRSATTPCLTVRAAQSLQGKVVSVGENKTTIVAIENINVHPLYSKRVKRTTRHTAHDDKGECQVGDIVMLKPCRPLSKKKRFIVDEVVFRGNN
jgi:small subunit ribosomal protein S17